MFPIYLIVGLINIFSQHHNYGIKIDDPNFDVRVRRSAGDAPKQQTWNTHYIERYIKPAILKRDKRYAYYKKTGITNNDLSQNNNSYEDNVKNNNGGSQILSRYDVFNPDWSLRQNTTRTNHHNSYSYSGLNNSITTNNRPVIRSYPYGYPPGYGTKTNPAAGSGGLATTPGYRIRNGDPPVYYNYQNPDGQNFAGYVGYTANKAAYNSSPLPYTPRYMPRPNNTDVNNNALWNNALAPYPPSYAQKPVTNTANNNFPSANNNLPSANNNSPTANNSGIHNLPYAPNPTNGLYNNFNSIPTPFKKDNLSQYAPSFNNSIAPTPSDTFVPTTDNSTLTTTERIVINTACVICRIPCPQFMRRFGRFCVPDEDSDDY